MPRSDIKDIIIDQEEEKDQIVGTGKIIDREDLHFWRKNTNNNLIKVTLGVRRAGKTTFSHLLLKDHGYAFLNFDDERLAFIKKEDLNHVLEGLYAHYGDFEHLLLDEVQNIHGWELFVNRIQRSGIEVYVTGSNANLLGKELSTHLTGRTIQMEVLPFSFREFLTWKNIVIKRPSTRERAKLKRNLEEYIKIGGFPEVVQRPGSGRMYLSSLFSSIIAKDIVSRYRIRFVRTLQEMATTLVSNFSNLITFNKLKNTHLMKSVHTAKNYMGYLSETYLIQLVEKYSPKPKEIANSPKKVYVIDTGLINAISVSPSERRGGIMENLVFLELMRKRSINPHLEIYYWRDYKDHEVDFVLRRGKRIEELIQVTYARGPDEIRKREKRGLLKCAEELRCKRLLIVTWDYDGSEKAGRKRIIFKPLWKWLLDNASYRFPGEKLRT